MNLFSEHTIERLMKKEKQRKIRFNKLYDTPTIHIFYFVTECRNWYEHLISVQLSDRWFQATRLNTINMLTKMSGFHAFTRTYCERCSFWWIIFFFPINRSIVESHDFSKSYLAVVTIFAQFCSISCVAFWCKILSATG